MEQGQAAGISPAIDIRRFCALKDDPRTHLHAPWAHNGSIVATNGSILIALNGVNDALPAPFANMAVSVPRILATTEDHTDRQHMASLKLPEFSNCGCCDGSGLLQSESCAECFGKGEVQSVHRAYCCVACDGEGLTFRAAASGAADASICGQCFGTGQEHKTDWGMISALRVGEASFNATYLLMLSQLPNCVLFTGSAEDCGRFEFDGGWGLVMPMRVPA